MPSVYDRLLVFDVARASRAAARLANFPGRRGEIPPPGPYPPVRPGPEPEPNPGPEPEPEPEPEDAVGRRAR